MLNLGQVVTTVQKNCHISDAQYAGDYTLCIFLLKMREFYRWENQIAFTGSLPRADVGRWMQEREQMWESMESSTFEPLTLGNDRFDPFDADSINRTLVPQGYVYSAGYGRFNKPHFFLGALQRQEQRDGNIVYVSACEYARDLVAPPAMLLNGRIYLRQESLRRYLWERIEEWRLHPLSEAAVRALACYDFEHHLEESLDRMTEVETESVILHEIGEALAGKHLGAAWHEMLATLSRSKGEIMVRAARDLLADCLSTLPRLVEQENAAALHFYFASFSGMRRYLFPEALAAYQRWAEDDDAQALRHLVRDGAQRWLETTQKILELHRQLGAESVTAIENLLEHPPTCQILSAH
ncbi:MAG: hypothetical protein H6R47_87 [Proteobacteria bacterium]|nr:hypothetical protein [Pseudomonadota bacterium]